MKVMMIAIIETDDFGEPEFKKEIEKLIDDIDPDSSLIDFVMAQTRQSSISYSNYSCQHDNMSGSHCMDCGHDASGNYN